MIVYDTFSYKNFTLKIKMLHVLLSKKKKKKCCMSFLIREENSQKIIQTVEALV